MNEHIICLIDKEYICMFKTYHKIGFYFLDAL